MSRTSEYTTPLNGTPYYVSTGVIKAVDKNGYRFSVGEISYQRFDDQNFQYVITPYWDEMSSLPSNVFFGIPGVDLEHRQEHYYRVNLTPSFIEMRTPGPSREDLWELLESVGLDYYDRFEWLLRSETRCGDDNLIVIRKRKPQKFDTALAKIDLNALQNDDEVSLCRLYDVSGKNNELSLSLLRLLNSGAHIRIKDENRMLSAEERRAMLFLLKEMIEYSSKYSVIRQQEGIRKAKDEGKYTGRKKLPVDPIRLRQVASEFRAGTISEAQAMEMAGIKSRSTFYRRMKEIAD